MTMKNKLMIIGAGDFQLPLVEKAAEKYDVILVAPSVDERFDKLISKKYLYDVRDKETILDIAKREGIVGVITDQTDIPVRTVAYVAEKLGLNGIGYEISKVFTDKNLMREKLKKCGLPYLPYLTTSSFDEAKEFFNKINSDVIVKPLDTQGSRGVFRVKSADDLEAAFNSAKAFSTNNTALIEKYVVGDEVVIEGITVNGEVKAQICGDTIYFDDKSTFSAKKRVFPSRQSEAIVNKALEVNKNIVKAFGLNNGITHGEYIIDGNEVYLIEIAARGGGVFISSDLISTQLGIDVEEFLIDIAVGNEINLDIKNENVVSGYRAFYLPEGKVVSVNGIEEVKNLPYVKRNQLDKIHVGLELGANVNKTSRFALIIVANSFEKWTEYENEIKDLLQIKVENNSQIFDIIWE